MLVAAHAGYALARFTFPGKQVLAFGILATAMIPGISVLVPLYALASKVKLYDGYSILVIVCTAWQVPTTMWLLKGFFEAVPRELDESALAFFDPSRKDWVAEPGAFEVLVGASSSDVRLKGLFVLGD